MSALPPKADIEVDSLPAISDDGRLQQAKSAASAPALVARLCDLRSQYRKSDLPATAHVAVATIKNPYAEAGRVDRAGNLDVEARLEPRR